MKVQSVLAMAMALGMVSGACSSSSGTPSGSGGSSTSGGASGSSTSGGSTGSGGSGSGGAASKGGSSGSSGASCTTPGGAVTGTWTVTSASLSLSGSLDMQSLFALSCPTGQVTGTLQVTGTWTAKANGTFEDGTTTTGTEQLSLPAECKVLSKAPVTCDRLGSVMQGGYYDTASCVDSSDGGCTCTGTVKQAGSMAFVTSDPQTNGNFTTASNTITNTQDSTQYSYCVSNNKLTLTPQGTSPAVTGTIVLQSGTSTGSGGTPGGGGSTGNGGSSGSSGGSGAGGVSTSGGKTGAGGAPASGGSTGGGGSSGNKGQGPCDIYAAANMPCGAAYSMVRSLSSKYSGPLYQVRSGSSATNTGTGGATQDIGMLADGYADSAVVDTFCTGATCSVSKLYDQSGNGNDLLRASAGPSGNGSRSGNDDYESVATKLSVTAGGHKVYALYIGVFGGYRTALSVTSKGVPSGNKDQGIYELIDGTHFGGACCWDFGSVSPNPKNYVTMNTVFFGTGFWGKGAGSGPWFGGDFEGGVWMGGSGSGEPGTPGSSANANNPTLKVPFALGILHTPVGKYALRMADISTATDLTTGYDGAIPAGKTWGNAGGIGLGIGGDNSNNSEGTFFEGAVVNGSPSNATDLLIMKNIQAVGYQK